MIARITPTKLGGAVCSIPSKSMAHRLLICAALSDGITRVRCNGTSEDIEATVDCLRALGSNIVRIGDTFIVPKVTAKPCDEVILNPRESGTTLRFMICVVAGLGLRAKFEGADRLFERPLDPLIEALSEHGIVITRDENNRIIESGIAIPGDFTISGDVSSQYISGLLLMMPLLKKKSTLTVTGRFESKPYVDLTVSALRTSGLEVAEDSLCYSVSGDYSLTDTSVEGDWSNSAFWLCAGAIGDNIKVTGLDLHSAQGDMEIVKLLKQFGARVIKDDTSVSSESDGLSGIDIDVSNIPDLVPILSVAASLSEGTTRILNAGRLRLKESDRLETVTDMINALGGCARIENDSIVVEGRSELSGGTVNSNRDHRIAMSAAVAAIKCKSYVTIIGAEAVNKSYPTFFDDYKALGGELTLEE